MGALPQEEEPLLSIVDAVETLSVIVDYDFQRGVDAETGDDGDELDPFPKKAIRWLNQTDNGQGVKAIKKTFGVVLDYLRNFYKDDYHALTNDHTMEGIKTIMLLVGEAAKKLDHNSSLFSGKNRSVTQLEEYRNLQRFYENRVSKKIDESLLGKWILGLAKQSDEKLPLKKMVVKEHKKQTTQHVFIDLEAVKQDIEYELFVIRKEDGLRFFNPALIRNMKLVCDFSSYFGDPSTEDLIYNVKEWEDRSVQASSSGLLRSLGTRIDHFYKETVKYRQREVVALINKALMALLLSSNSNNLRVHEKGKTCSGYFRDFQGFLVEALRCREYQKLIAYPPSKDNGLANAILEILHAVCRGIFVHLKGFQELAPIVDEVVDKALQAERKGDVGTDGLWEQLAYEYKSLEKALKKHPNGPLKKILENLETNRYSSFDPLNQGNLPTNLFSFYSKDEKISSLRIPSPTSQELINKVAVSEEFIGYLRACTESRIVRKHLLVNLQDRTSWCEIARCKALEALPLINSFGRHLTVVTLAMDTEFYHQISTYEDNDDAELFMEQFMDHLRGDHSGFFFPDFIKEELFPDMAKRMMNLVHRIFFREREVLTRHERLDFIQIAYIFLALKLIDCTVPDSFSFTCKDAVDVGGSLNALIFSFFRLMNHPNLQPRDLECLHYMLYGPSLLVRERLMHRERFHRFISALRTVEAARSEYGAKNFALIIREGFEPLFKNLDLKEIEVVPPQAD